MNSAKELNRLLRYTKDIVDEIVVVDGMSNDDTVEIAKSYGARVFIKRPLGYPDPDRIFAMNKCSCDWIFHLDVDEIPNKYLRNDLRMLIDTAIKNDIKGYSIARINYYFDHGPSLYSWPDRQIRIYNKKYIEFKGLIHEQIKIHGKLIHLPQYKYYIIHLKKNIQFKKVAKYVLIHRIEYENPWKKSRFRSYIAKINPLFLFLLEFPINLYNVYRRYNYINLPTVLVSIKKGYYRVFLGLLIKLRTRRQSIISKIIESYGMISILKYKEDNRLNELIHKFIMERFNF